MSSYSDAVLADSPTAYWRLGESSGATAFDSSGAGHDGTYMNAPTLAVDGALRSDGDTAVSFDGVDQWLETTTLGSLGSSLGSSSWEFWINTTETGFKALVGGGTSTQIGIYLNSTDLGVPYDLYVGVFAGSDVLEGRTTSSGTLNDGAWHHVVVLVDGVAPEIRVYVDGLVQPFTHYNQDALTPSDFATNIGVAASNYFGISAEYVATRLDEVAAYPSLLSEERIVAHYVAATWVAPQNPQPALSHTAQRLYDALAPLASEDEENGWALARYCGALAAKIDLIADLSRDQEDGTPGWAILFDLDECPALFLPWLAQFIGVDIPAGLDDAQQRQRIRETAGFRRGTPDAIRGAARQFLTGAQTVFLIERQGGAYKLAVSTLGSETPDSAKVEAALLEQKPAGLSLVYTLITGGTFDTLRGTHTDFTDVAGQFATFDDLRADPALT